MSAEKYTIIDVPEMTNKIKKVYELSNPQEELQYWQNNDGSISIEFFKNQSDENKYPSVIVVEVVGMPFSEE